MSTTTTFDDMDTDSAEEAVVAHEESDPGGEGILGASYRALTIGIITLVLLVAFEAMAVTTTMPVAVRELDGMGFYAWGFSGFMVASMFATVVAGEVADKFGPVRPFLAGVGLFVAGLIVAGSAPNMPIFVLGRAIQGLGGGALVVTLFVIAGRAYTKAQLPKLMAAFSSAWVLPSIVGPLLGGAISDNLTWRLVFLGLVPLAIFPILIMLPRLRKLPVVEPSAPKSGRKLLALGAAIGIGAAQYAGESMKALGWWSLLLALVGLALVVVTLPRLLPAGAVRFVRGIPSIVGTRGLLAGSFFGAQAFLPLMLKDHRGLSSLLAGLILTVGALGWSSGSWWQGRSGLTMKRSRIVTLGALLVASGTAVQLLVVFGGVPVILSVLGSLLGGLGMGLATSSLSVLLLTESPTEEQGANSAGGQLADALGQVVFIGIGGVLFAVLHATLDNGLAFIPIFALMIGAGLAAVALGRRVATPR